MFIHEYCDLNSSEKNPSDTFKLLIPDWLHYDTIWKSYKPFALWTIGDQYLLYHWLDYALNKGYEHIEFYTIDRPAIIRNALERAKLWPIKWTLKAIHSQHIIQYDSIIDHLPGHIPPIKLPIDGWSLLSYWMKLNQQWLNIIFEKTQKISRYTNIGRFCFIHPTTKLISPYWIGDHVHIGPHSIIGPHAIIGEGAILPGPNYVHDAIIAPRSFLNGHTELKKSYLLGGRFFDLKYQVEISQLDPIMASQTIKNYNLQKPPIVERIIALWLWIKTKFTAKKSSLHTLKIYNGKILKTYTKGTIVHRRRNWLLEVIKGNLRLIGILPRTQEQLNKLSQDWQDILKNTPIGVFSYADIHGCFSPENEMEAIHAVYQATQSTSIIEPLIKNHFQTLFLRDPDVRA